MLLILRFTPIAIAHEKGQPPKIEKTTAEAINKKYLNDVKPIFEKKCFDCHTSQTRFPWYSKIPGIKQLIQTDIKEAKEHLDMEPDFPFKSHASPLEDLDAIKKSIFKNEMPPLRYRMMHSGSGLTPEEKETVYKWVQFGKEMLNQQTK